MMRGKVLLTLFVLCLYCVNTVCIVLQATSTQAAPALAQDAHTLCAHACNVGGLCADR